MLRPDCFQTPALGSCLGADNSATASAGCVFWRAGAGLSCVQLRPSPTLSPSKAFAGLNECFFSRESKHFSGVLGDFFAGTAEAEESQLQSSCSLRSGVSREKAAYLSRRAAYPSSRSNCTFAKTQTSPPVTTACPEVGLGLVIPELPLGVLGAPGHFLQVGGQGSE